MSHQDKKNRDRWSRTLLVLESFGVGAFYIGMLAILLYPVVKAAA